MSCRKCGGDGVDGFMGPCDCVINAPRRSPATAPTAAEVLMRTWDITTPEDSVEAYAEMSERQKELDAAARLRNVNEFLTRQLKGADARYLELRSKLDLAETELAQLRDRVRELEAELGIALGRIRELREDVSATEQDLATTEESVDELHAELATAHHRHEETRQQLAACASELAALRERVARALTILGDFGQGASVAIGRATEVLRGS